MGRNSRTTILVAAANLGMIRFHVIMATLNFDPLPLFLRVAGHIVECCTSWPAIKSGCSSFHCFVT